jgi:hypothetical protein
MLGFQSDDADSGALWRDKPIGDGTGLETARAVSLGGSTPSLSAQGRVRRMVRQQPATLWPVMGLWVRLPPLPLMCR